MTSSPRQRYGLLTLLYISQAIPLGFFIVAVPGLMRSRGVGLEKIGLLSAIALPFLIKFLWAPWVDRYGSEKRGHYRSWLLVLQAISVAVVVGIATLDLSSGFGMLVAAGALFMLCGATQDVATDGLAVRILGQGERGLGNGIQVGGYYLGQILGGGLMLILLSSWGWAPAVLAMALFLALPIVPTLRLDEPPHPVAAAERRLEVGAIGRFFTRPGALGWVLVLLTYRSGEAMAMAMVNPMLIDRGLSLAELGVVLGVVTSSASLAGALSGGALVNRMGRRWALIAFGALQAAALLAFRLIAAGEGETAILPGSAPLYAILAVSAFAGGMATAALYTRMMDASRQATAATDFSLQQSLAAIGPLILAASSGFVAQRLGYGGHFVVCAAVAAGALVLVLLGVGREAEENAVSPG